MTSHALRKILCFNTQGYYDNDDWLGVEFGFLGRLMPHPRRIPCQDWVSQKEIVRLLAKTDLWLAQEVPPKLFHAIQTIKPFHSVREKADLQKYVYMHNRRTDCTTDILFDPDKFVLLWAKEICAKKESSWRNCHSIVMAKFLDKALDVEFFAASGHLEAGLSRKSKHLQMLQLKDLFFELDNLEIRQGIIGFDSNEVEPGEQTTFNKLLASHGLVDVVQGKPTYDYSRTEVPFWNLATRFFGFGKSLDKLASKNLYIKNVKILDLGKTVSDHFAITGDLDLSFARKQSQKTKPRSSAKSRMILKKPEEMFA